MMEAERNIVGAGQGNNARSGNKHQDSSSNFFNILKQFDIYTKIEEDYRVRTSHGAILSLAGWVIIALLVFSEVNNFLDPKPKEHMVVDTTLGQKLKINLNISFHSLTCAEVHFDAMDVAGDNQLNIEHDMIKQRLSPAGNPVGDSYVEIIGQKNDEIATNTTQDGCGSCFGAESDTWKCCNSCDDLRLAYDAKGWSTNMIMKTAEQCLKDKRNPYANVRPGEGCQVSGTMIVNKVAGNFHMTLGESFVRDGAHIHQFIPAEAPGFNVSHTIHSLSFGDTYPSMPPNPLDKTVRYCKTDTGTGLFQYFIKVIPTHYSNQRLLADTTTTNQYTVTEKFRPVFIGDLSEGGILQAGVIPGIFFVYELAPFLVTVTEAQVPLSHLITRLLAIVGGVFSVLGIVDALLFRLNKLASKNL